LTASEPAEVIVATGPHAVRTSYHQTTYESACGPTVFRVRFRNGPDESGRVDHLSIDGRIVPGAAELLDLRAARRMILSIGIMNCGKDSKRPVFVGSMNLEPSESRRLGMRWLLVFRLTQQGGKGWSMSID
jgi:hypothetical protein